VSPSVQIRPFRRSDREQLAALVNAHVAAVVPGVSVSVNALMNQLEREPGEAIVDPWVVERQTLVAIEREAVVAGAHLLRYGSDEHVGESYRGLAEIRWLVCRPDAFPAGADLVVACLGLMDTWGAARQAADGALPAPFVYGVPSVWPHVRALYTGAGFACEGKLEIVLVARVGDLPSPGALDLDLRRTLGTWTRLSAFLDGEEIGFVELETDFTAGGTLSRFAGWADVGNLWVAEAHRRRGVGTWLLGQAPDWLQLGGASRLVAYAWPEQTDELGFYGATGFRELVRSERGWIRDASAAK
jgi:GNAT superfamily N-acetyltransferase